MSLLALVLLACTSKSDDIEVRGPHGGHGHSTTETPTTPQPTHPAGDSDTDTDTDTDADTDTDTFVPTDRRWDCRALDPADPAPLGGKVALTFDDGPDEVHTAEILDVLRANDVPAAFLVLGDRLSDPDVWPLFEEMVDDPLVTIGNHSWDHPVMTSLVTSDMEAQIDDTTALIQTFGITPTFFRFPYGESDCDAVDRVTARGYRVLGWHIDTGDWCYAAVGAVGTCTRDDYWRIPTEFEDDMIGLTMEQIRRFDGGIVLFHDIHAYTADELQNVIDAVKGEGFEFTTIEDLSAFPLLNAGTPADLPYLGEACDLLNDECWMIEHEAWCEPIDPDDATNFDGLCTLPCEGYCLDRDGAATTFCADVGAGQCVGKVDPLNAYCGNVPGSQVVLADRYVGSSGAAAASADVCFPTHWP